MIGKALLPPVKEKSLLPAAAEGSQSTDTAASPIEKVDENPAATPPKVEVAAELPQINSVPKTEVEAQVAPAPQRPLSPYPWVIFILIWSNKILHELNPVSVLPFYTHLEERFFPLFSGQ